MEPPLKRQKTEHAESEDAVPNEAVETAEEQITFTVEPPGPIVEGRVPDALLASPSPKTQKDSDPSPSKALRTWTSDEGQSIQVRHGDLTREFVDSIVNAANGHLSHGAGVAGAIARNGGPCIQEESTRYVQEHGALDDGEVALTSGGKLPAQWIIHAVGPVYSEKKKEESEASLERAVLNSLTLADQEGFTSIAFPAISSGIFGFPKERCAGIMFDAVLDFFGEHADSSLKFVRFTNVDAPTVKVFVEEFDKRFREEDESAWSDIEWSDDEVSNDWGSLSPPRSFSSSSESDEDVRLMIGGVESEEDEKMAGLENDRGGNAEDEDRGEAIDAEREEREAVQDDVEFAQDMMQNEEKTNGTSGTNGSHGEQAGVENEAAAGVEDPMDTEPH